MVKPILKKFTVLETVVQGLHFVFCNLLDIFAPWPRKWGSSWPTVVFALHNWLILILCIYFYALYKWLVSYCSRGQLAHASRCTAMHERFHKTSDSRYYERQSPWEEWCRISYCSTSWWASCSRIFSDLSVYFCMFDHYFHIMFKHLLHAMFYF